MAIDVQQLPTNEAVLAGPGQVLTEGDSFEKPLFWREKQSGDPLDFTGYTMTFEVVDSSGTLVETGTVVPAIGDATGDFTLGLTTAQTSNALMLAKNTARFIGVNGAIRKTFICSPFTVSACP